jgi:hypothetical protein
VRKAGVTDLGSEVNMQRGSEEVMNSQVGRAGELDMQRGSQAVRDLGSEIVRNI